ncbi:MAG: hypothetical protein JKX85_01220 [Phycisphaeraceae bacterium]|nr:hypothetical protein [Phycisphaeraceae bacterium]
MLMSRGLVDVLFILLCGTIVLLSESVRVGSVKTAPAEIGSGGISAIQAKDVKPVVVDFDQMIYQEQAFKTVPQLLAKLESGICVLLITANKDIPHHRVMKLWSQLHERGVNVNLGAKPIAP